MTMLLFNFLPINRVVVGSFVVLSNSTSVVVVLLFVLLVGAVLLRLKTRTERVIIVVACAIRDRMGNMS